MCHYIARMPLFTVNTVTLLKESSIFVSLEFGVSMAIKRGPGLQRHWLLM